MHAQVLQIRSITHIRRSQSLPVPGNVRVHVGQKVYAGDLLAEADVSASHVTVDVPKILGLPYSDDVERLIERKVGEKLEEKDIIAETGGLFSRVIRTPAPGTIVSIQKGVVQIETGTRHLTLESSISGLVSEIRTNQKIYVEANGSLIQAAWGNGKISTAPLTNAAENHLSALSPASFGIELRGTIVIGGICVDEATLTQAAALPIAGLVLGSMPARLIEAARRQPYPVILTDGFGLMGMNELAFRLLSTNGGREVTASATKPDLRKGVRPEVFIPLPVDAQPAFEYAEYKAGQLVRETAYPHVGEIGLIEKISSSTVLLPSGLRAQAAEVKFNQEKRIVPLANLEVISIESEVSAETK
jgi:hypothetical protein